MVNWTRVLDNLIATSPAIIAAIASAIYAFKVHKQIKTPSGKPIGEVAEFIHDTSIANNLLLSKGNGHTVTADHETIKTEGADVPQIPDPTEAE